LFKSADADADSYRFRLLIEPGAILEPGYAIDAGRAAACRREHELILETPPERLSPFHFFAVNAEFHELIASGSRNGFIIQAVQQQNRLRRLLSLQWPYAEHRIVESCTEHLSVLTAIEQGELEWASALMRRHLELAARTPPAR
jgi:DNA-binding GntR family transcriptional regulator